ncbi:glycoside hydrolase family 3 protein [Mrakia frigida]|uniref:glycoside hydrolase family 3 protein n=1 Tax=Mrakia frigida TaxID=29902 RepID=UPI003FCBFB76
MIISLSFLLALASQTVATWAPSRRSLNDSSPLYKDSTASVEDRVADLLPRMTLAEKVSQITQGDFKRYINLSNTDLEYNATALALEMATRGGQQWTGTPNLMNREKLVWAIELGQRYLMENTTLGIPALYQTEGLHGFIDNGTTFPSPIAMGCSWNPKLMEESAARFSLESGALGITHLFAPVLDLGLEPRFGRVEEGFGEDYHLTGQMGLAFVNGLQGGKRIGAGETATISASATCKHFSAFATPENGLNLAPVHGGERELRSVYNRAFKTACMGAGSIMTSYNSYDGVALSASYLLLTEILRNEWDYQGFVTTDAGATDNLMTLHKVASTREECAKLTIENGLSVEMGGGTYTFSTLESQVAAGTVDEKLIDRTVGYLLATKFKLGLFESPYPYSNWSDYDRNAETAAVEYQMDLESVVLLKNEGAILPIKNGSRVALIGPQAGQTTLGDYVFPWADTFSTTPLDGFQAISNSSNLTVTYAEGCKRWSNDESQFEEAVAAANSSDVAVVMVGTWSRDQNELWAGLNATTGEHVDVADLGLVGAQLNLVKAIKATGTPTVVVFVSGRGVSEPWIAENIDAIVQQFYPGEAGGTVIAELLTGLENFSGKMSLSVPRGVGEIPSNYNYQKGGRYVDPGKEWENGTLNFGHQYVLSSPVPLWSFGHGEWTRLSYSNFTYNSLSLSGENVTGDAEVTTSISVTNVGEVDGYEVVQVYYTDVYSSVVTAVKQLISFDKIWFAAGETKTVDLVVSVSEMALWNVKKEWLVEPGEFIIWAGGASNNLPLNSSLWVV